MLSVADNQGSMRPSTGVLSDRSTVNSVPECLTEAHNEEMVDESLPEIYTCGSCGEVISEKLEETWRHPCFASYYRNTDFELRTDTNNVINVCEYNFCACTS